MENCLKSIKMLVKRFPSFVIYEVIYNLLSILSAIIPIYMMSDIIKYYQENTSYDQILVYILIRFLILAIVYIILYGIDLLERNIERLFIAKISEDFYYKLSEIDYDFHESPEFLNDYTRALEEGVNNIYTVAKGSFKTINHIIQSISVFAIIATMGYVIILIALGIGILYLLCYARLGFLFKKQRKEARPYQRTSWYTNRAFTIKDGMADIKTSDIDKILIENNELSLDKSIGIVDKYNKKGFPWAFGGQLLLISIYPITVALLAFLTTDIATQLASFASLTVAASSLSGLINKLAISLGDIESVLPDCKIPFDLLEKKGEIEGIIKEDCPKEFTSLEIKNLDFSYQGKGKQLDNINIKIKKGDHIAIVGANGAGKTTLVKLLLRLYDPNNGYIQYNGMDYKDITARTLREKVGAVFQNVEVYAVTIAENILLRKPISDEDYKLIDDALKFCDLYDYVYSLKDNINTEISREFHNQGAIFSKGQNQRLAIARGYAQNYQVFILDEPSSSLDPIAEAKVYKNMLEMGRDKTLIFISHRLTTTVNADCIYLFDNGSIIEAGNHDELMKLNKVYHQMFTSQSCKYIGEDYE